MQTIDAFTRRGFRQSRVYCRLMGGMTVTYVPFAILPIANVALPRRVTIT